MCKYKYKRNGVGMTVSTEKGKCILFSFTKLRLTQAGSPMTNKYVNKLYKLGLI